MITPESLGANKSEDGQQAALMQWCALNRMRYPMLKWVHSIPNGGSRNIVEATKMRATGTRKGVLDLFLPWPAKLKHGLYIEMKKADKRYVKNGGLTPEQVEFAQFAVDAGYKVAICYSWQEARDAIVEYLK